MLERAHQSVNGTSRFPLASLRKWTPFHIDALGLVTLLGADEVNNSAGRLVRSKFFEYMPLLGAFVFASDAFTERRSGFTLHNITDGIVTPELAGWLTRWLMAQEFKQACSVVKWRVAKPTSTTSETVIAFALAATLLSGFLALTILMKDWWGFVNVLSMAISVVVRGYLLSRNRAWLDKAVEEANKKAVPNQPDVKMIVITSDAKAVIMEAPSWLVIPCFIQTPKPSMPGGHGEPKIPSSKRVESFHVFPPKSKERKNSKEDETGMTRTEDVLGPLHLYQWVRWFGWLAFGAHIISIGESDLVSQLLTVGIIVIPTFAVVRRWGCDETRIGSKLEAEVSSYPPEDPDKERRIDLYAYLDLSRDEEENLIKWNLMPVRTTPWWTEWDAKRKLYHNLRDVDPSRQRGELNKRISMRRLEEAPAAEKSTPPFPSQPPQQAPKVPATEVHSFPNGEIHTAADVV